MNRFTKTIRTAHENKLSKRINMDGLLSCAYRAMVNGFSPA